MRSVTLRIILERSHHISTLHSKVKNKQTNPFIHWSLTAAVSLRKCWHCFWVLNDYVLFLPRAEKIARERGRGNGEPWQAEAVEEGIRGPGQALKTHAEPVETATRLAPWRWHWAGRAKKASRKQLSQAAGLVLCPADSVSPTHELNTDRYKLKQRNWSEDPKPFIIQPSLFWAFSESQERLCYMTSK